MNQGLDNTKSDTTLRDRAENNTRYLMFRRTDKQKSNAPYNFKYSAEKCNLRCIMLRVAPDKDLSARRQMNFRRQALASDSWLDIHVFFYGCRLQHRHDRRYTNHEKRHSILELYLIVKGTRTGVHP